MVFDEKKAKTCRNQPDHENPEIDEEARPGGSPQDEVENQNNHSRENSIDGEIDKSK
jgi:hypothetical protein